MSQLDSLGGAVIMFDGPDGVGKTTQLELTAKALRTSGLTVETLHVLGGTSVGDALRSVLFSELARPVETDIHIVLAIHYALVGRLKSLTDAGKVVLVDRSPLSIIAYQVFGAKFDQNMGYEVCDKAMSLDNPDLIVIYQAPIGVLVKRRKQQNKEHDYFERQTQDFHNQTIAGYAAAAKHYGIESTNASGTLDKVHEHTMRLLKVLALKRDASLVSRPD